MPNYAQYLFIQNDQASDLLDLINQDGPKQVIKHLIDHYVPTLDPEIFPCSPWGESDTLYKHHNWTLSYNTRLTYVGLCRKLPD